MPRKWQLVLGKPIETANACITMSGGVRMHSDLVSRGVCRKFINRLIATVHASKKEAQYQRDEW
jgi:hypothetical protein